MTGKPTILMLETWVVEEIFQAQLNGIQVEEGICHSSVDLD
jgi:hypothetical protein